MVCFWEHGPERALGIAWQRTTALVSIVLVVLSAHSQQVVLQWLGENAWQHVITTGSRCGHLA
jgi:hypothetical protein